MMAESAIKNRVVMINSVRELSSSTPGELPGKDRSDDEHDLKSTGNQQISSFFFNRLIGSI